VAIKANEENLFDARVIFQKGADFPDGNSGGALQGKSVDAGAYGGEGQSVDAGLGRQVERSPVAVGKQLILGVFAAAPHRSHGVDNPPRREAITARQLGIASGAAL
jgi:hypothetical protein